MNWLFLKNNHERSTVISNNIFKEPLNMFECFDIDKCFNEI